MTQDDTKQPSPIPNATDEPRYSRWLTRLARWASHPKAPLVAGGALLLTVTIIGFELSGQHLPSFGKPAIVVFDPIKFINAQRAAASFMAASPSADTAFTMTQVARQAEAVIREEAHGAIVLVKQTVVVAEDLPDITDAVLRRFGLSTAVPTVHTKPGALSLESIAPTDSSFSAGKLSEDYRMDLQQRTEQLMLEDQKTNKQATLVP